MNLEFYGAPGCGKTYLVELITGVDRSIIAQKARNKYVRILKKFSCYTPTSIVYRMKIGGIVNTNQLRWKYFDIEPQEMINSFIMVGSAYKLFTTKNFILDEGLIQRIISFSINFEVGEDDTKKIVSIFKPSLKNTRVVYIDCNRDQLFYSIEKRSRKIALMDFLNQETLIRYVDEYLDRCIYILNHFNFEFITRDCFDDFVSRNRK